MLPRDPPSTAAGGDPEPLPFAADSSAVLAEITQRLGHSLDVGENLRLIARLAVPRLADWCVLYVGTTRSNLTIAALHHADPGDEARLLEVLERVPLDFSKPDGFLRDLVERGEPTLIQAVDDSLLRGIAGTDEDFTLLREFRESSAVLVPLETRSPITGLLAFVRGASSRAYAQGDLALFAELVRRASAALDNAHLHAAERAARIRAEAAERRLNVLARAGELIAEAMPDLGASLEAVAQLAQPTFGIAVAIDIAISAGASEDRCVLAAADPAVRSQIEAGKRQDMRDGNHRARNVVEGRGVVVANSFAAIEAQFGYPPAALETFRAIGVQAMLGVPLTTRGRTFGVFLALSHVAFTPEDVALAEALATRLALGLENRRLFHVAEQARRRMAFLAEASGTFQASLDFNEIATRLAALVVPAIAPSAVVDVPEGDGMRRVATEDIDPVRRALLQRPGDCFPLPPGHPIRVSMSEGRPIFVTDISTQSLEEVSPGGGRFLERARELGYRSGVSVPLVARGRIFGVLSVGSPEPGFDREDFEVLRQVADRAALALDNARLLAEARDAREQAERDRERFAALIAQSPAAVVVTRGPQHICELLNPVARSWTNGQVQGRPASEAFGMFGAAFLERLDEVYETGVPFVARDVHYTHLPGPGIFVDLTWGPLRGADGAVNGILLLAIDVTERALSRRSEAEANRERDETLVTLDTFLRTAPIGFALIDRDMRYQRINEALARTHGAPAHEHLGRTVAEMIPDVFEKMRGLLDRVLAGETFTDVLVTGERPAAPGEQSQWIGSFFPVRQRSEIIGAGLVAVDVSDRMRAQRDAALLSEAGETLSASLDIDSTLAAFARLLVPRFADAIVMHLDIDDVKLHRVIAFASPPHDQELLERLAAQWKVGTTALEQQACASGEPVLMRDIPEEAWRALPMEQGDLVRQLRFRSAIGAPLLARGRLFGVFAATMTAASERRFTKQDLDLVRTLAARASMALDNARLYTDARDAIRVRDDFLSIAGHELRTPLTALGLNLASLERLLKSEATAHDKAERAPERVDAIKRQVRRLEKLSGELLDVTRLASGHMQLTRETFDLRELAVEVIGRFDSEAARAGAQIHLVGAAPVVGSWDRLRLDQVLTNLVANALKYGAGRAVEVSATADGSNARLDVRDHGIGIAAEHQGRIFERFERAVSPRQFGGFGLGLWIVRQIIENHGGSIRVESEPDCGSRFIVTLPRAG